ncbi:MAG: SseB family protein [Boseongicola sp.]|nr:MAG: SseB family protein [Boseongicola sp.]
MNSTALDLTHQLMTEAPEDTQPRMAFYECLAVNELFLLLKSDPDGDNIEPQIFETSDGTFALVFDREYRLTEFTGQSSPYAALTGRAIASMIKDRSIGLGLNLGVAPSSMLIPADAVHWLVETLGTRPTEENGDISEVSAPFGLPGQLVSGLDTKLALAAGLAKLAYLVAVKYQSGQRGHLLAMIDPIPGAESDLAQAISDTLVFSGIEAGQLDVAFFQTTDPIAAKLAKVGLRFDLPTIAKPELPSAPGTDPAKPPRLR